MQRQNNPKKLPEQLHVQTKADVKIPYYGTCRYLTEFFANLNKDKVTYDSNETNEDWIIAKSTDYGCPTGYYKNTSISTSILDENSDSMSVTLDVWTLAGKLDKKSIQIKTNGNHELDKEIKGQAQFSVPVLGEIDIDASTNISDTSNNNFRFR